MFLSRNPDEHHQIVLVPGRNPAHASTINQISFRVISLPELRRIHARLTREDVASLSPTNHGGLGLSDDEIYRTTEAMVERTPGHMKRVDWHERTRRRMLEDGTIEQRAPAPAS